MKLTIGERISDLMHKQGLNQKELSNNTQISEGTISGLLNDNVKGFSYKYFVTLAEYFNVSTDYLLGLSDVPTNDKDLQFVCDYTGLNEETVNFIHKAKDSEYNQSGEKEIVKFIEYLLSNPDYYLELMFYLRTIINLTPLLADEYSNNITVDFQIPGDNIHPLLDYINQKRKDLKFQEANEDNLEMQINNAKYRIEKIINKLVDLFSLSSLNGISETDFKILEAEHYRNNETAKFSIMEKLNQIIESEENQKTYSEGV